MHLSDNKPVKVYRNGNLQVTRWDNEVEGRNGQPRTVSNFTFKKSFQNTEGEWQETTSLGGGDLQRLAALLDMAHKDTFCSIEVR